MNPRSGNVFMLCVVFALQASHVFASTWVMYTVAAQNASRAVYTGYGGGPARSSEELINLINAQSLATTHEDSSKKTSDDYFLLDRDYFLSRMTSNVPSAAAAAAAAVSVNLNSDSIQNTLKTLYEDDIAAHPVKGLAAFIETFCKHLIRDVPLEESNPYENPLFERIKAVKFSFSAGYFVVSPYYPLAVDEDNDFKKRLNFSHQLTSMIPSSVAELQSKSHQNWIGILDKLFGTTAQLTSASKPEKLSSASITETFAALSVTSDATSNSASSGKSKKKNAKKQAAVAAAAPAPVTEKSIEESEKARLELEKSYELERLKKQKEKERKELEEANRLKQIEANKKKQAEKEAEKKRLADEEVQKRNEQSRRDREARERQVQADNEKREKEQAEQMERLRHRQEAELKAREEAERIERERQQEEERKRAAEEAERKKQDTERRQVERKRQEAERKKQEAERKKQENDALEAEKKRLAKVAAEAEKERIAKAAAEKERLANEAAEKKRIAKENEEKERLAKAAAEAEAKRQADLAAATEMERLAKIAKDAEDERARAAEQVRNLALEKERLEREIEELKMKQRAPVSGASSYVSRDSHSSDRSSPQHPLFYPTNHFHQSSPTSTLSSHNVTPMDSAASRSSRLFSFGNSISDSVDLFEVNGTALAMDAFENPLEYQSDLGFTGFTNLAGINQTTTSPAASIGTSSSYNPFASPVDASNIWWPSSNGSAQSSTRDPFALGFNSSLFGASAESSNATALTGSALLNDRSVPFGSSLLGQQPSSTESSSSMRFGSGFDWNSFPSQQQPSRVISTQQPQQQQHQQPPQPPNLTIQSNYHQMQQEGYRPAQSQHQQQQQQQAFSPMSNRQQQQSSGHYISSQPYGYQQPFAVPHQPQFSPRNGQHNLQPVYAEQPLFHYQRQQQPQQQPRFSPNPNPNPNYGQPQQQQHQQQQQQQQYQQPRFSPNAQHEQQARRNMNQEYQSMESMHDLDSLIG